MGHPGIGSALETLLRIEDRYDTRRVQSLDQMMFSDGWKCDLALVDGVIVESGRTEALVMPTIVLSGSAIDGQRLSARLRSGRGWLRKDATADELRSAIDRALGHARMRLPQKAVALAVAAAGAVAVLAALAALVPRG